MTTVARDSPVTPSIREARRADLLDVHRIERASFPQPWPYSAFETYLGEPGFLVATTPWDDFPDGNSADRTPSRSHPDGAPAGTNSDRAGTDGDRAGMDGDEAESATAVGRGGGIAAIDDHDEGIVTADDAIAGYVVADTVPNHGTPLGHVKDLAVHPDYRNDGIGSALLERALGVLAAQGAGSVKLEVRETNEAAIDLYRAFDFEHRRTVPGYYGNGDDALVMVRFLD